MITAAIVGANGLVGQNLIKLIERHPQVVLKSAVVRNPDDASAIKDFQKLKQNISLSKFNPQELNRYDIVFLALPHGIAKEILPQLKTKVIDLTADHRQTNAYGLPEVFPEQIKTERIIANPGCYATAAQLAVMPIQAMISHVVFNGISGYSGAGKHAKSKLDLHNNIIAYQLTKHNHTLELSKYLTCAFSFTPHVINTYAGLMITAHIFPKEGQGFTNTDRLYRIYTDFYHDTMTKVIDTVPDTKMVLDTPNCVVGGFQVDSKGVLVVVSVIDNLMKGAASQAVENMNLMFNLPKKAGLL